MTSDWKKIFKAASSRLEKAPSPLLVAAQSKASQATAQEAYAQHAQQLGAIAGAAGAATGIGTITTGSTGSTAYPYGAGVAGMGGSGGSITTAGTGAYPAPPTPDWRRMLEQQEKNERKRNYADKQIEKARVRLICAGGMLPLFMEKGLSEEEAIAKALHLATKLVDANERIRKITDMLMEGEKERSEGDAQEAKQA